jgi:predicted porin
VTKASLNIMAQQQFGDMVKAVVDIEQGINLKTAIHVSGCRSF